MEIMYRAQTNSVGSAAPIFYLVYPVAADHALRNPFLCIDKADRNDRSDK